MVAPHAKAAPHHEQGEEKRRDALGFGILTTPGMLYLTKKKGVKLALQISAAVEGRLTLGDYGSMMGSLEHVVFATNRDRAQMLGLWRPLRGGVGA